MEMNENSIPLGTSFNNASDWIREQYSLKKYDTINEHLYGLFKCRVKWGAGTPMLVFDSPEDATYFLLKWS
jgi:hypothetical protein